MVRIDGKNKIIFGGMDTHRVFKDYLFLSLGICGSDAEGTISVVPGIESGPIVQ